MNFQFIIIFILSLIIFFISLISLKVFIRFVAHTGFIDTPDHRSNHSIITPSSAGIPVFIAIALSSMFLSPEIFHNYTTTAFGIFLIFLLGAYDDLKDIRARYKVIIIALVTVLSCWDGIVIMNAGTYFGYTIPLTWLAIPLTLFSVLGFTNALNLIDGVDGLAGTISIIILGSLWSIGYQNNDLFLMGLPILIIPALLAFLIYNWYPAKIFMGDSGSLTLGFVISLLSIKALEYVNPIVMLFLIAIPVIDTFVIISRRRMYGQSIFHPDKNHAHHVLYNYFKGNVKMTVIVIALLQLVYTILGMTLVKIMPQAVTLPFFLLTVVAWYFVLTRLCDNHPELMRKRSLRKKGAFFQSDQSKKVKI